MRVSVLVVMPAHQALRTSSLAAFSASVANLTIDEPTTRGGLQLDPKFPPLPLSAATPNQISLAAATANSAPMFVARGTIDAEKIDSVRAKTKGVQIFADPEVGIFPTPGCAPGPIGKYTDVATKLDVPMLKSKKLDGKGVAVAIMDTGINLAHLKAAGLKPKLDKKISWAPPGVPLTPGNYALDHATMYAFDALIAAPACTLLDFPILQSTTPGGSQMAGFLSDALLAFSYLHTQFASPNWKYKALVVNNSWGMYHPSWDFPAGHPGRYADNPNHPFNIIVGTLARAGADILFAAGNCGADCPDNRCQGVVKNTITGANASPDVLTLAGCDVTGKRVGYSSQGPAIPGFGAKKPDVTAYTHFLGSQAFGAGTEDSGTSAACPVTSGCVAAIRTRLRPSKVPPAQLFGQIIADALTKPGPAPGWNKDYGAGIIQPVNVAAHFGL